MRKPIILAVIPFVAGCAAIRQTPVEQMPVIAGEPWKIAGNPDLGELTTPKQQPVDFGIWRARDGTWQLWSCIRNTKCEGRTRLFYRWEGKRLEDADWKPMGIAMQADPTLGETPCGLQAPYVHPLTRHEQTTDLPLYLMFYGDWTNICLARSEDGKHFERWPADDGKSKRFSEGPDDNARDPMTIRIGDEWYCYYTAYPKRIGSVYCRTSKDLREWSESKIVARGGRTGTGPGSAECPFVVRRRGFYYLFRTQKYGTQALTSVYRSENPLDFGVDDDRCLVVQMPIAAPEIIVDGDREYIAYLLPDLKGIRIARLEWQEHPTETRPSQK